MRDGLGDVRKVKNRYPEIVRDAFETDGQEPVGYGGTTIRRPEDR